MNHRLTWLDATRGLAALIVLSAHTVDLFWRGYANLIQVGNAGVVLFFICSGYVISISLDSTMLGGFWLRRFFRLFPLYWVSSALFLALGMSAATNLWSVIVNLTMLQLFFDVPYINTIFWSLTVEVSFYVLMSALKALGLLARTFETFLGLMIILTGLRLVAPGLADLLIYLPVCMLGTLLYRFDQGRYRARELLGGLAVLAVYLGAWPAPPGFIFGWLSALGLFLLIYRWRALFRPAPLVWCGQVSYSIYLLHGIPLWQFGLWGLPVVLPLAAASHAIIEAPGIALGRRLLRLAPPA